MNHIIDIFLKKVKEEPHKKILVSNEKSFTFQEVHYLSEKIMQLIQNKKNDIVPLYIKNDMYILPTLLGIIKSGKIPLPLSTSLHITQAKKRIEDITYDYILVDDIEAESEKTIEISRVFTELKKDVNFEYQENKYTYNTNAYIIMTSGTTGIPKKVVLTQDNISWIMENFIKIAEFNKKSRFLFTTPYTFDVSITELFSVIYGEGILYCFAENDEVSAKLRKTLEYIETYKITHLSLSPSYAEMICDINIRGSKLNSLECISLAGEVFPYELSKKLQKHISSDCKVYNFYGPSETTVYATYYRVSGKETTVIPIGKPLDETNILVLNDKFESSRAGELFIGGRGLSNGYLNREELNQEKFITIRDKLYYRTGDFIEVNNNGDLIFKNRKDDQVQINGIRVELEEINSIISSLEGVLSCKTVYRKNKLVSFVIKTDAIIHNEIQTFVKNSLPSYSQPKIIVVSEFILNQNRKLDVEKMINKYEEFLPTPIDAQLSKNNIENYINSLFSKFEIKSISELNSIEKIKFIVECEQKYKCKLNESLMFLDNAKENLIEAIIGSTQNENIDHKRKASDCDVHDKINMRNVFLNWYTNDDFETTLYEPLYFQKHYDEKKYNSVLSFSVPLYGDIEIEDINRTLYQLTEKIDILRLATFKENNRLFFKELKPLKIKPLIFCVNQMNEEYTDFISSLIHEKYGNLLYFSIYSLETNELYFYFSHHILDKASFGKVQQIFTESFTSNVAYNKGDFGSYLSFIRFMNQKSSQYDIECLSEVLPDYPIKKDELFQYKKDSLQYFKLKISEHLVDSYDISKYVSYISSKMLMQDRELENVRGSMIVNLRKFKEFNARNVIGDIHSTIPFVIGSTESKTSFNKTCDNNYSLYEEGVNIRNIIYLNYPNLSQEQKKYKELWEDMELSINYLGEVKDCDEFMQEVLSTGFRKNYVISFTQQGYLYVLLIGRFAKNEIYEIDGELISVFDYYQQKDNSLLLLT
ncbi:AMP-binding protein [Bacillus paramycoides]|uniref:AMP-binding protein n=1 Tax=Bacillus paramycoides TaxID=2026194 RepID=UPI003D02D6C6